MSTPSPEPVQQLPAPPARGAQGEWALFLDVDGTLLDFAHHPDAVQVDPALRGDLVSVGQQLDGAIALLSGRPLAELDALFAWRGRAAAGLHGAELRQPDGHLQIAGNATAFAAVRRAAAARVAATAGVMLEDKQRAIALHFRRSPAVRAAAERIAHELAQLAGAEYNVQAGDHVYEVKPANMDKGRALEALMASAPFHGRQPWMVGDDLTDEDAFASVNAAAGISVIVGARRPTVARYALRDPAAVRAWLHALAQPHA